MRQELHDLTGSAAEVAWALRRRGLLWVGGNAERELIFAESSLAPAEQAALYQQMHSYAFRLFLRDIIHHRAGFGIEDVVRYVSPPSASHYLELLSAWRVIEPSGPGRWRLRSPMARSFGETLEWYVAQLFSRAFGCTSAWSVRAALPSNGGDFDVLALVEGRLICVEVKSAPPKHITVETIVSFLRRIEDLGPALSIFLEDTHLRLEDKIVPLFAEALAQRSREHASWPGQLVPERRHLYSATPASTERNGHGAAPSLFVFSSRPSLEANLAYCLRRLLVPGSPPSAEVLAASGPSDPTLPPEPPASPPVRTP